VHYTIQRHYDKPEFVFFSGDSGSFLEFKRGDLIELDEDSVDMIQSSGWCYGLCVRTGQRGDFPAECVYILPTMTKPPAEILVLDDIPVF